MELTITFSHIVTFNFPLSRGSFHLFKLAPLSGRQNKPLLTLPNPPAHSLPVNCQTYWESCLLLVSPFPHLPVTPQHPGNWPLLPTPTLTGLFTKDTNDLLSPSLNSSQHRCPPLLPCSIFGFWDTHFLSLSSSAHFHVLICTRGSPAVELSTVLWLQV